MIGDPGFHGGRDADALMNTTEIVPSEMQTTKVLITHRFKFNEILDAYETFAHAADTRALKVIIEA